MANETNNETTANETSDNMTLELGDAVKESGILDTLMDSPELMVCIAVIAALAAYVGYTQPKIRALVLPLFKKYDDEIMAHLDKALSKVQMKAYEKLDDEVKKQVNNKVLQDVIMSAWDEKDDMMADTIKLKVKAALDESK
jgi:hypothetical protein|tara:strand:- start:3165 stop:3587 length:423 start_codon:yes stop_codon:yes gene_type:complete